MDGGWTVPRGDRRTGEDPAGPIGPRDERRAGGKGGGTHEGGRRSETYGQ